MFEKLCVLIKCLFGSLFVNEDSSMATIMPVIVATMADSLVIVGIVVGIIVVGGIFIVSKNPTNTLPKARRVIGLVRLGLSSFSGDVGMNRGSLSKVK